MPRIAADITWLIGRTPLVELSRIAPKGVRLVAKLEGQNPSGSNKDRTARAMIEHAERQGYLPTGGTLVECSSGDLGIALALVGRRRGYRVILTAPDWLGPMRASLLRALGADVVLTPAADGMAGAMARADSIAKSTPGAVCLQAFSNAANSRCHEETTAREIWEDTDGLVDDVVVPVGTGGTAAGCAAFFQEHAGVAVIGVEPASSPVLTGHPAGCHDIPGIGAGFIPDILAPEDLDEIIGVTDQEAAFGVQRLVREESILAGPASGAVLAAALKVAARPDAGGRMIAMVFPDSGERFLDHRAYLELLR